MPLVLGYLGIAVGLSISGCLLIIAYHVWRGPRGR